MRKRISKGPGIDSLTSALQALGEAVRQSCAPIPDDAFTVEQLAERRKVTRRHANDIARDMARKGIVKGEPWRRMDDNGRVRQILIYRLATPTR